MRGIPCHAGPRREAPESGGRERGKAQATASIEACFGKSRARQVNSLGMTNSNNSSGPWDLAAAPSGLISGPGWFRK